MTNKNEIEIETMTPDSVLVMELRGGSKKALRQLVERHKKTAYNVALGMVANRDDAFDISQEAFLRVYKSAHTYDKSQPFLPWFYRIISNLSKTWLSRRTKLDHRMVDIDEVSYLVASEDNPEQALVRKETVARLRHALTLLSFEDREIITLQHFRGMSYDEIADLLTIPRGTVMSRLYYARKKLAELMRQSDG